MKDLSRRRKSPFFNYKFIDYRGGKIGDQIIGEKDKENMFGSLLIGREKFSPSTEGNILPTYFPRI
jgi:hypothetical protein